MNTRSSTPRRAQIIAAGIAGGLVASLLILLQIIPYGLSRGLTEVDEIGHVDYAIQLSVGHWPRWGDQYTQQTLFIADCAGSGFGPAGNCNPHGRAATDYWPNGWSYEAQQPPLGYVAHALTARAVGLMPPLEQLSWLRGTSLVLTSLGLIAIGALIGALSPSRRLAFAAPVPLAVVPIVVNSSQFVTNDSVVLLLGALSATPAVVLWHRRRLIATTMTLSAASGVAIGLVKPVALVAPLALLLWGLLVAVGKQDNESAESPALKKSREWSLAILGGIQLAAGLISTLGFMILQQTTSPISSSQVMAAVISDGQADGLPWPEWLTSIREIGTLAFHGLEPVTEFRNTLPVIGIGILLVALTLASLIPNRGKLSFLNRLPAALAITAVLGTIGWTFGLFIWGGYAVPMPGRYLVALLPLLAVMWLKGLERLRGFVWAIAPLTITLTIWMVWPIIPMWLGWA